ncbi:hypothetical protein AAC387_Pa03g1479 [Persea americana]
MKERPTALMTEKSDARSKPKGKGCKGKKKSVPKGPKEENGPNGGVAKAKGSGTKGKCFHCGKTGHWKRNFHIFCPRRRPQGFWETKRLSDGEITVNLGCNAKAGSITTWVKLVEEFYKKIYSKKKTASIRQAINEFHQMEGETLYSYLKRFKDLLIQCPHHGFEKIRLVQIVYEGLDYLTKQMVESFCSGKFTQKTADEAWTFLEETAENTLQWAPIKREPITPTIIEKGGMFKVEPKIEAEAKLATLMRRIEALELNQKPTPNTLESLKYNQAMNGGIDPATLGQAKSVEEVNALYQYTRFDNRQRKQPLDEDDGVFEVCYIHELVENHLPHFQLEDPPGACLAHFGSDFDVDGYIEENGVAERRNRTLLDMIRSMMSLSGLPISFWGYALDTAIYILNLVPSKSVPKTPQEFWSGRKPSLQHLHIWGCPAHVLKVKMDKLESKSEVCTFVGYPKGTKRWTFYNLREQKVLVSTNAVFLEEDYMIDQKSLEKVILEEIHEKSIPNPTMTKLEENPPIPNLVVTPVPRRSGRIVRPPDRFSFLGESYETIPEELEQDPCNYNEAINDIDSGRWQEAMKAKMESMYSNQVWTFVDLPANIKPIGCKWVYKRKRGPDGRVETFKARLVAKKGILKKRVSTMIKPSRR